MYGSLSPGCSGEAEGAQSRFQGRAGEQRGGLWASLKPARHPHEGAQGGASGGPRQQPQRHLVPGDAIGILAHDDVGHPGSWRENGAL